MGQGLEGATSQSLGSSGTQEERCESQSRDKDNTKEAPDFQAECKTHVRVLFRGRVYDADTQTEVIPPPGDTGCYLRISVVVATGGAPGIEWGCSAPCWPGCPTRE